MCYGMLKVNKLKKKLHPRRYDVNFASHVEKLLLLYASFTTCPKKDSICIILFAKLNKLSVKEISIRIVTKYLSRFKIIKI